jgi:lipopolysaccharide export system permease protein
MRILNRVIRNSIFASTLLVSAVIAGIQSFLSLVQQFSTVGNGEFSLYKALIFVLMQLPAQCYQLFPITGFLGTLIGLTRLASSSQLIIMRSSGVSVIRIAWSVVKTAVVMILVITTIGEGVGPSWQQQSEKMRENALFPTKHQSLLKSVWLHQDNQFTRIGELKNQSVMRDVTSYHFTSSGRMDKAITARSGQLVDGQWVLSDVKKTYFLPGKIKSKTQPHAILHAEFKPNLQIQMSLTATEENLISLYNTIHYRQSIGLGINQYLFTFLQRLLQPITTLVMICLAVPFVFGSFRSTSAGMKIISGVFIGFTFYMLNQLLGPITLVYQFPPLLAALLPTCLFLLIVMTLLLRVK